MAHMERVGQRSVAACVRGGVQCEDDLGELGLCKLQLQQRQERPQVPTSVGPWMLEQLEQTPRQQVGGGGSARAAQGVREVGWASLPVGAGIRTRMYKSRKRDVDVA